MSTDTGAQLDGGVDCVLTPEQIEGPFYFDIGTLRADTRDGRPGRTLSIELRVVRTTETKANAMGIPLLELAEAEELAVTIDGADEIDAGFHMVKGGGGALLREKVVASITRREVIVVGPDKVVDRLGRDFPLPVEVAPFALPVVERALARLGSEPRLRTLDGSSYRTDNGNLILDCRFPDGIADPAATEIAIATLPGVVECGLFVGLAHTLVIGHADGTAEVREQAAAR